MKVQFFDSLIKYQSLCSQLPVQELKCQQRIAAILVHLFWILVYYCFLCLIMSISNQKCGLPLQVHSEALIYLISRPVLSLTYWQMIYKLGPILVSLHMLMFSSTEKLTQTKQQIEEDDSISSFEIGIWDLNVTNLLGQK